MAYKDISAGKIAATGKQRLLSRMSPAGARALSESIRLAPTDIQDMTLARMEGFRTGGISTFVLDAPVALDSSEPAHIARFLSTVCLLRDATGLGIAVDWQTGNIPDHISAQLQHLLPPRTASHSNGHIKSWRRDYAFGRYFWKKGPDFAIVTDRRNKAAYHKFVITGEAAFSTFMHVAAGRPLCGTAGLDRKSLETLEKAGVVLAIDNQAIVLPYRLSHPPVPAYAIESV